MYGLALQASKAHEYGLHSGQEGPTPARGELSHQHRPTASPGVVDWHLDHCTLCRQCQLAATVVPTQKVQLLGVPPIASALYEPER